MTALTEVLEILGEAAQTSRAYYMETQVDSRGTYWRLISEWHKPDVESHFTNPAMRRLSIHEITGWTDRLNKDGFASASISDLAPEEKGFMESLGTRSTLHFAVAGRHELPGCIGFDQVDQDRPWGDDEIAALQTAAATLANTIVREDLFTQVQINLAETEGLYQASARLNSAATNYEILDVLRQHTSLGHLNASNITLNVFDRPWDYSDGEISSDTPEWLIPIARWSAQPLTGDPVERYPLKSWSTMGSLLHPEHPTSVIDVANDPRIDDVGRSIFLDQMNAKSIVYVPLNVAGQWIGHIIGAFRQTTGFPEQELRRLISLAGQAAVAVQNLQSIDLATRRALEAQRRNEELAALNQITAAASRSLDQEEVLNEVIERLLQTSGYDSGLISIVDPETQKLVLSVHKNLPKKMIKKLQEDGLDGTPCDLVFKINKTIHVDNLTNIPASNPEMVQYKDIFNGPVAMGFQAYLGVPLESKGQVLGTVCIFHQSVRKVGAGTIAVLQAAGQQLGVFIENLRLFQRTQVALSETETLYQASAELSAVQSFDDILDSLRKYTVLGSADKLVSLVLFNKPWVDDEIPEWGTPFAQWTTLPNKNLGARFHMSDYPAIKYLSPTELGVIEDLSTDSHLTENIRTMYLDYYGANSMIFAPVFAGGQWLGFINGVFGTKTQFSNQDARRLVALAGQAAIAVQNLRLLEETRRRANQLQTAAEIARATSSTLALDTLLQRAVSQLRERFDYYQATIFLLDESGDYAVVRESTGAAGQEMIRRGH